MKKTHLIAGLSAFAILATAAVVQARPGSHGGPQMGFERPAFAELDADGDGQLTAEEFAAHAKARFDAADTDGDGALSAAEMAARAQAEMAKRMEQRMSQMIERRDTNGDGMLSFDEAAPQAGKGPLFGRIDANGDGTVTAEEYAAMAQKRGQMGGKPMFGGHGQQGKHPMKGGGMQRHQHQYMVPPVAPQPDAETGN